MRSPVRPREIDDGGHSREVRRRLDIPPLPGRQYPPQGGWIQAQRRATSTASVSEPQGEPSIAMSPAPQQVPDDAMLIDLLRPRLDTPSSNLQHGHEPDQPLLREPADGVPLPGSTDNPNTHHLTCENGQVFYVDLQTPLGDVPWMSDSDLLEPRDSAGFFVRHDAQVGWDDLSEPKCSCDE